MAGAPAPDPAAPTGLVDWGRLGRRLRLTATVLSGLALAGWLVTGLASNRLRAGDLGGWVGLALALMFVVEVVVVGGSALRGMLRAGERGERLAAGDVGILPPQLRRRH